MFDRKKDSTGTATELETEEPSFLVEPRTVEVGSGYTLSIKYDENQTPTINVKTYGNVNIAHIRREIEKNFPHAHIHQLDQAHTLAVVKIKKRSNKKRK